MEEIIRAICGFNLRDLRETSFSKLNPNDPPEFFFPQISQMGVG